MMHQMERPGRLNGYKWMYNKCLKHGIHAKKEGCLILAPLEPNYGFFLDFTVLQKL